MQFRLLPAAALAALAISLAGCAPSHSAAWLTAQHLAGRDALPDATTLNPHYRYLRVTTNGTAALLVLGYLDPNSANGPTEVWYSAGQEVIRLQNGRLTAMVGIPKEWRAVRLPNDLPAWRSVSEARHYVRQRDEMPGYRIGLNERVTVRPTAAPRNSALKGIDPASLRWFEESFEPTNGRSTNITPETAANHPRLQPARYAVHVSQKNELPVYGEQCVDPDICLSWQVWPPSRTAD